MDISKEYAKMCDHSIIQNEWKANNILGSTYYRISEDKILAACANLTKGATWLPLQDDIQDMCKKDEESFCLLNHRFQFFWEREAQDIGSNIEGGWEGGYMWGSGFETPEKMWLGFYMEGKYSLIWDGKEWIEREWKDEDEDEDEDDDDD